MTNPTIHLNGSGRKTLLEGYCNAGNAVNDALRALREASPNARDYYPGTEGDFRRATDEHVSRLARLESVLAELQALAEFMAG